MKNVKTSNAEVLMLKKKEDNNLQMLNFAGLEGA